MVSHYVCVYLHMCVYMLETVEAKWDVSESKLEMPISLKSQQHASRLNSATCFMCKLMASAL